MGFRVKISEAFELYRLEHIVYLNQSARTEEMNKCAMNALISFVGDVEMAELTFDCVRKWKEHLEKTKSQNTVRGYILKLRVVLKHLNLRGYAVLNYQMVGVPKRADKVVDFLTPADVDQLIQVAFREQSGYSCIDRHKNRAIISLLYSSGIRVSELCSLDKNMMRDDLTFTIIGKGGKARLCFFDDRTKHYINTYLALRVDSDPCLFYSERGSCRIKKGGVQVMVKTVGNKAGFNKPIHPHIFRHSFATDMLRNNTNLIYLKEFLGHSSVQTTEMYTHVVDEDLKAIYREKHTSTAASY